MNILWQRKKGFPLFLSSYPDCVTSSILFPYSMDSSLTKVKSEFCICLNLTKFTFDGTSCSQAPIWALVIQARLPQNGVVNLGNRPNPQHLNICNGHTLDADHGPSFTKISLTSRLISMPTRSVRKWFAMIFLSLLWQTKLGQQA